MKLLASLGTLLALSSTWLNPVSAKSATGDRVLVLVPKQESSKHYSLFLDSLVTRGFDLSITTASNSSVSLQTDGQLLFDHAILLAPAAKKIGNNMAPKDFVRFVNDGGNLVVAAGSELSEFYRKLAMQFGVEFEPRGSWAVDHLGFVKQDNGTDHRMIATTGFAKAPAVLSSETVGDKEQLPVFYKGIAHKYQANNPLLIPLLVGEPTTYSGLKSDDKKASANTLDVPLSGRSVGLVSVFQTRENARVAFSGSTAVFSNALFRNAHNSNQQFITDVTQWTLQEKSVLRSTSHRHYLQSTGEQPDHYLVSSSINYQIDLSVYKNNAWHPYIADDVQFEAIMLDPYIRATLNHSKTNAKDRATYHGDIKLPDRYGTFTFRVNYKRTGYSNVDVRDTVAIWPLRHDGYPRFLSAAYPYYAASFVMVLGFLALSAVWLWNAEQTSVDTTKVQNTRDDDKKIKVQGKAQVKKIKNQK
ncbi:oligosaccharyl transferase glycoprotein complex, beta subunit [Coemansia sp. RSA 485]|nr:oligosaccharyl transferase glycoprotein complex, beta subunit [Coemansia sp. RSA 485]